MAKGNTFLLASVAAFTLVTGVCLGGPAQTKKVDYKGWKDAYELTNGIARIVVVPELGGRIMEYSVNDRSIVWINPALQGKLVDPAGDWSNYGGYKLWNAPQDRWGWPPDPGIDNEPAEVKVLEDGKGLKIIGQPGYSTGLRFVREIYMAADSPRVVVNQHLLTGEKQDLDWSVWDVTQVITPGMAALPTNPGSAYAGGLRSFDKYPKGVMEKTVSIADNIAVISHNSGQSLKFGADSPVGWAAYTSGNLLYVKRFPGPKAGEKYPDKGLNTEVYISGDMGYVEVEILGPMTTLDKGGRTSFNEEWYMVELKEPFPSPEAFRQYLTGHPELLVWGNN